MICSVCIKAKYVPLSDTILKESPSTSEASFDLKPTQKKIKLDLIRAMASSRKCLIIYVARIEKIIQPLHLKVYCLSIGQIYLSEGA